MYIEWGTLIVAVAIAYWIGHSRGEAKVHAQWSAERDAERDRQRERAEYEARPRHCDFGAGNQRPSELADLLVASLESSGDSGIRDEARA
jgi:hypothetical protein